MEDPRFATLQEALASYASDPDDPEPATGDHVVAAVSLVLRGTRSMELLLIKRAEHDADPWSGHMALPGGRREAGDEGVRGTAVRETREETGVELAHALRLGRLEEVAPATRRLPRISVWPFVFGVPATTPAHPASVEVERTLWVPLARLRSPEARDRVEIELPSGSRAFPCFRVEGEVVWGLTYRILEDFFAAFSDDTLAELARPR